LDKLFEQKLIKLCENRGLKGKNILKKTLSKNYPSQNILPEVQTISFTFKIVRNITLDPIPLYQKKQMEKAMIQGI